MIQALQQMVEITNTVIISVRVMIRAGWIDDGILQKCYGLQIKQHSVCKLLQKFLNNRKQKDQSISFSKNIILGISLNHSFFT